MTKPMTAAVALLTALGLLLAPIAALADDAAPKTDATQATDNGGGGDSSTSNQGKDADQQTAEDVGEFCNQAALAFGMAYWAQHCKKSDD
ncbi:MAG: hypothetical protein KDJ16_10770 [Hyphomicrobiales bacterium]|nr:hypothetical protein [Hyphomicrobiales bacterium]